MSSRKGGSTHFKTMLQSDVPQGRNGKHKKIVSTILEDLEHLKDGSALRIPLTDLADGKAKVRSALNRASRKRGENVATASDGDSLYVWNQGKSGIQAAKR